VYECMSVNIIYMYMHVCIGIGAGKISGLYVGGVKGMWEFFLAGTPINEMGIAGMYVCMHAYVCQHM